MPTPRPRGRHAAPTAPAAPRLRRSLRQRMTPTVVLSLALLLGGTMTAIAGVAADGGGREAAVPTGYSIWPDDVVPAVPDSANDRRTTVGVEFTSAQAGRVTAVQFYRAPGNSGPHRVHVWDPSGRLLASKAVFRAGTGWVTVRLDRAVRVDAGRRYTASYTAPRGHYAADPFALGRGLSRTSGSLTALRGVYTFERDQRPWRSIRQTNYYVDLLFVPDGSGPGSTTPTSSTTSPSSPTPSTSGSPSSSSSPTSSTSPSSPTTSPTSSPTSPTSSPTSPTSSPTSPTSSPTSSPTTSPTTPPSSSGFPDAGNTGVPAGTTLQTYTGPCTITTPGTVIDSKRVSCTLSIRAAGVVIRNSLINGRVENDENSSFSFTIQDSEVDAGDRDGTGIGESNFTALRVEVRGGNRSIQCWLDCTVRDSWVHGQFRDATGFFHESGIRMGSGSTIVHNSIGCDAPEVPPDAGCSAPLTGYGDFAPVEDNLIQNNLFLASTGSTCAYGGSSGGKPYSSGANNIRFIDNIFQRGPTRQCGAYAPVLDFNANAPGNVFTGNRFDDGTVVTP